MTTKYDRHLKEFIQAGAILREIEYDRIILDDKPDIIIEVDGKKIGLEMTECHASTILSNMKISRQKAINRVNVICEKYKDRLKSQGVQDIAFYIGFSFKLYEVLSKKRYDSKIVQEVLDAIDVHRDENELRLQGGEAYKQWLREHRHNRAHLKYVDSVKFYNVEGTLEVNQVIATLSTTIESECINYCIADKQARLIDYKIKHPDIDEYWLGIYFTDTSERFFDYLEGYKSIDTEYSRVYLLEHNQKMQVK